MSKVRSMMYIAMFAAIVSVLGFIPPIYFPFTPIPITAQTLGVMLAGSILGAKRGGLSLALFVLIVIAGAPVLSGGRGTLAAIFAPSGGYVLAFPIAAYIIGWLVEKYWEQLKLWKLMIINVFGGLIVIYAIGIPYLSMMTGLPLGAAALTNLIYIPGDIIKVILASLLAWKIRTVYPLITKRGNHKEK